MRTRVSLLPLLLLGLTATYAAAQKITPVSEERLKQLLPATVFIDGENVPTQERNAAMVALPNNKVLIASLIDTAGYSSAYQEKYTGIVLSQIGFTLGSKSFDAGAYAFGRKKDGESVTLLVYNVGGDQLAQVATAKQENLRPVKPLQIIVAEDGSARFYLGPYYVALQGK